MTDEAKPVNDPRQYTGYRFPNRKIDSYEKEIKADFAHRAWAMQ